MTRREPGVYTPLEFVQAVTDEHGRLDPKKQDALFKKHGEDVSINGPPGIADQIQQAFANGFIFAGVTEVPGSTMEVIKWVRDKKE
jgi:hypothetical protein